jgi:hypothetical protein
MADVLWKLTADDLKDLGVTIVGHRRKIMTAIAEPSGSAVAPAAAAETKRLPQVVETTQATAERRQPTVLFCDLAHSGLSGYLLRSDRALRRLPRKVYGRRCPCVGQRWMSARIDPEDMRDVSCGRRPARMR